MRLLQRGLSALKDRRWRDARTAFQGVLAADPSQPDALHLLGIALFEMGEPSEAMAQVRMALAAAPENPEAHYHLGMMRQAQGDHAGAESCFRQAAELLPEYSSAWIGLGGVLRRQGRLPEALQAFRNASHSNPRDPAAHLNIGDLLWELGHASKAQASYRRALELEPGYAEAHNNLGISLLRQGDREAGLAALRRAVECAPGDERFQYSLSDAYAELVPGWHVPMLNDRRRNEAFERAIERTVRDGFLVLEIGAGSGLLAMIAARAGAREVISCESVRPLAEAARGIVARNGLASRVRIVEKRSTDIAVGRELPRPADLLIAEIFDNAVIGEGALPTLRHATANLIAPEAKVIPAGATVWAVVVECPEHRRRMNQIGDVCGFDLRDFDLFRPRKHVPFDLRREAHRVLTEPFEVAHFDFRHPPTAHETRRISLKALENGTAQGMALWFDMQVDEESSMSTGPNASATHWMQALQLLDRDVVLGAGQTFEVNAARTDVRYSFRILT